MAWTSPSTDAPAVDLATRGQSERAFMSAVYAWMFGGLASTGAVAAYTVSSPELLHFVMRSWMFLLGGELILVLALSFAATRVRGPVAAAMFVSYAVLNGLTLSSIFLVYRLGSIGSAFFVTAGAFGAMSLYGTVTRRDLSAWRAFLFIGLFGVVLAGVVNLFVRSDGLSFVWSCACVVVFAGLTAYDTQKLRRMRANAGGVNSLAIVGALMLYLDFINLFLAVIRLTGRRR